MRAEIQVFFSKLNKIKYILYTYTKCTIRIDNTYLFMWIVRKTACWTFWQLKWNNVELYPPLIASTAIIFAYVIHFRTEMKTFFLGFSCVVQLKSILRKESLILCLFDEEVHDQLMILYYSILIITLQLLCFVLLCFVFFGLIALTNFLYR